MAAKAVRVLAAIRRRTYASEIVTSITLCILPHANRWHWFTAEGPRGTVFVIAPPGGGNIGDQALLQACLDQISDPVCVIVNRSQNYDFDKYLDRDISVIEEPSLVYGAGLRHILSVLRLGQRLHNARALCLIAADTLDGAYNELASVNRLRAVSVAAQLGVDSRVLGFSWNSHPKRTCRKLAVRAGSYGVKFYARDPLSFERLERDGVVGVISTADIVFNICDDDLVDVDSIIPFREYAVVNASGLVDRLVPNQEEAYANLLDSLRRLNQPVVLVPHVIRPGGDDLSVLHRILSQAGQADDIVLIDKLLSPIEVLSIVRSASIVVSGRMHLSVLALKSGVPAVTIGTQGKVEGLLSMFDCLHMLVSPTVEGISSLTSTVDSAIDGEDSNRARIVAALPRVKVAASANFEGLYLDGGVDADAASARPSSPYSGTGIQVERPADG